MQATTWTDLKGIVLSEGSQSQSLWTPCARCSQKDAVMVWFPGVRGGGGYDYKGAAAGVSWADGVGDGHILTVMALTQICYNPWNYIPQSPQISYCVIITNTAG